MILEANNPATLAAQTVATQREGQAQRANPTQQSAVERAQTGAFADAERANATGRAQTRQAVEATETREQRVGTDRSARADRTEPDQPPAATGGRGQLVDVYA